MELINLLPNYYRDNKTMEELQGILSADINGLSSDINETINQCFVNTATSLLSRYEKIYGIQVDVSKSNEFRRERIRAKIRGVGTVTKKMIEATARSYSNGEVEVIEDPTNYCFKVKFVGVKGIPANMADLTVTIEEIKPAHLAFEFEYTYNLWNDVLHMTWEKASAYTWKGLRER